MEISIFKSANKIVTGKDSLNFLIDFFSDFKIKHPLILSDKGVVNSGSINHVTELLNIDYKIYSDINPEPELDKVEKCIQIFNENNHDCVIAVGGGSVLDIAKCVASLADKYTDINDYIGINKIKDRKIYLVAIPTTSGTGSEVTNIAILTDTQNEMKKSIVSNFLLPDISIISPYLSISCPQSITASSGVDALVHAIEAYISLNNSDITDALALAAIKLIGNYLPKTFSVPSNVNFREKMANASLMAGLAFGNAGVGAVHALAYPLGGKYKIPHGFSNALILPHVLRWNLFSCPEKFTEIAKALNIDVVNNHLENANKVIVYLETLIKNLNIPSTLREYGIDSSDIPNLANEAIQVERLLNNNPRKLSIKDIENIYLSAY